MTAHTRRKLLVLGGIDLPLAALREALGPDFELLESQDISEADAIVADPHQFGILSESADLAIVLEHVRDAICVADRDGKSLWCNQPYRELPREAKSKIRKRCVELLDADDQFASTTEEIATTGGRAWSAKISRVPAADGPRLIVVATDVSAERRYQQKVVALNRAGDELLRLDANQIREMNVIERLRLVEDKIVRSMHDLLHFDNFTIRLVDQSAGKLETVITRGIPDAVADFNLFAEETGSGVSGWVASTGKSYICSNTETDSLFLPGMEGASSSLTVPLRLHDRVIGIMDIESTRPDAFSDEDMRFAEIFARHIAMTLHFLELLVVERSVTNATACGRVEGELTEPLEDIFAEAEAMIAEQAAKDPKSLAHLRRIKQDVEAIRSRVREAASGPQSLLGVERAMQHRGPEPGLIGKRILIADDEQKIRRVLGDVLRHRGCAVLLCENGSGAIEALENLDEPIDLVISDIKMPDRNGYEVFHAARRAVSKVPVILMTGFGYDPHHSIVRASDEGLQAVLFKPFAVEKMIEEVRKAVGAPPPDA